MADADADTRYYAAKCLREIGPAAGAAAPALKEATKDSDPEVLEAATSALKKVSRRT